MRKLKQFNEFINEAEGIEYLQDLGLVGRNQRFFENLEKLLELCPNLKQLKYPESAGGNMSHVAKKKEPEDLYHLTLWMNVKDKISDEDLKSYRRMRDERRYAHAADFLEEVAKKMYGEQEIKDLKASMADEAKREFESEVDNVINHLQSIDRQNKVDLYVWDVYQSFYRNDAARIPYNMKKGNKYDLNELIDFIKENPGVGEAIHDISISLTSEKQGELARRMSAGELGSLD